MGPGRGWPSGEAAAGPWRGRPSGETVTVVGPGTARLLLRADPLPGAGAVMNGALHVVQDRRGNIQMLPNSGREFRLEMHQSSSVAAAAEDLNSSKSAD